MRQPNEMLSRALWMTMQRRRQQHLDGADVNAMQLNYFSKIGNKAIGAKANTLIPLAGSPPPDGVS
jgi:hypothetical protein